MSVLHPDILKKASLRLLTVINPVRYTILVFLFQEEMNILQIHREIEKSGLKISRDHLKRHLVIMNKQNLIKVRGYFPREIYSVNNLEINSLMSSIKIMLGKKEFV